MNKTNKKTIKKGQYGILAIIALAVMCALPAQGQWLPEYMPKFSGNTFAARVGEAFKVFAKAVKAGDLAAIQKIVKENPTSYVSIFSTKIQNRNGQQVYPICVAVERGYDDVIKYMTQNYKDIVKQKCGNDDIWNVAIKNKKAHTAVLVWKLGTPFNMPPFVKVAYTVKDARMLKTIIPGFLASKANPNQVYVDRYGMTEGDSFYEAARLQNIHFITLLRDEMKKHNRVAQASVQVHHCPPLNNSDRYYVQGLVDKVKQGNAAKLLEKLHVKVNVEAVETSYGCN